jgi:hypothetical protein
MEQLSCILSTTKTRISRDLVIEWFEDLNEFLKSGEEYKILKKSYNWMLKSINNYYL